jgi:membrane complex biogenesis BtpA family protein
VSKLLIGMVHLPALPGAPRSEQRLEAIEARALEEARALHGSGFDGCIVENYGDIPFHKDTVEPITVAAMTRIVGVVCRALPGWRVGVNVLRNDARAALAIAAATGARFVRVNVHVGATATDQGVIEGRAAETLRLRRDLGAAVEIWADVHVKHGRSLAHATTAREAEDAVHRGLADAVIVSGAGTGEATDLDDVRAAAELRLGVPVLVGSGVTAENCAALLRLADGAIVGTALKRSAVTTAPLDAERLRRFVEAARAASGPRSHA